MLREAITNLLSKEGSNRKMDIVLISGAYIFWDGNVDVWWGGVVGDTIRHSSGHRYTFGVVFIVCA